MEITLVEMPVQTLVGMRMRTTLAENRAIELWKGFKPRVKEIPTAISAISYSVQCYDTLLVPQTFHPGVVFEKWAAVEVVGEGAVPEGIEHLTLPGGLYAHFVYKGEMTKFGNTMRDFFVNWLPQSDYILDHRPHFERLDERYLGPMNPDSLEDVYLPVSRKS